MVAAMLNDEEWELSKPQALVLRAFIARPSIAIGLVAPAVQRCLEELEADGIPGEEEIIECIKAFISKGLITRQKGDLSDKDGITHKYFVLTDPDKAYRLLRYTRHKTRKYLDIIDP